MRSGACVADRMVKKISENLTFEETADGDEGVDHLIFGRKMVPGWELQVLKALRLGSGGRGGEESLAGTLARTLAFTPERKLLIF